MGRTQLGNGRRGDAQLGVALLCLGAVERETQLVAGDAGFECQRLGSLQQALERKGQGAAQVLAGGNVFIVSQVPQHGQFFIGEELMLVHSGCPRLFIAG
jgi:hypothetical protein